MAGMTSWSRGNLNYWEGFLQGKIGVEMCGKEESRNTRSRRERVLGAPCGWSAGCKMAEAGNEVK
jgi:hypothetical protein